MCRLMAIVGRVENISSLLIEFSWLAESGTVPKSDRKGHKDGWGIALYTGGSLTLHIRGVESAYENPRFHSTVARASKLAKGHSDVVLLCHLRRASKEMPSGEMKYCQPFVMDALERTWSFQHNGGLVGYVFRDHGITDSEYLFRRILHSLTGPSREDLLGAIEKLKSHISERFRGYTSLNFMLTDGKSLHCYRDCTKSPDYYTLFCERRDEGTIVYSEPVDEWAGEPIKQGELLTITP